MKAHQTLFSIGAFCALSQFSGAQVEAAPAVAAPVAPVQEVVDAPATRVPAAMSVLVPDSASAFALTRSLNEIEAVAIDLANEIAPEMAGMVSLDMLISQLAPPGFDASIIDRDKPFGVAVGPISMMSEPQFIALIPTSNPDAIKSMLPEEMIFSTRISGGYLAITQGTEFPEATGKSKLLAQVPAGLIGVTIDFDALKQSFGPMIQGGMAMARASVSDLSTDMPEGGTVDLAMLMDMYFGMADDALESLSGLNLSLEASGTMLDLRFEMLVSDRSPMAGMAIDKPTHLGDYMHLIDDSAFSFAFGADFDQLLDKTEPFMKAAFSAYPEEFAVAMGTALDAWRGAYAMIGDSIVASGSMTENGMAVTGYFDGSQFDQVLAFYDQYVTNPLLADMGINYVDTKKATLADTEITRYTFDFDFTELLALSADDQGNEQVADMIELMKKIYGEQLVITLAKSDGTAIFMLGAGDEHLRTAIARLSTENQASPDIQYLSTLAGTHNPFFFERFNLGSLVSDLMPLSMPEGLPMPQELAIFEGTDAYINMYGGISKSSWTSGFIVDAAQVGRLLMKGMQLKEEL